MYDRHSSIRSQLCLPRTTLLCCTDLCYILLMYDRHSSIRSQLCLPPTTLLCCTDLCYILLMYDRHSSVRSQLCFYRVYDREVLETSATLICASSTCSFTHHRRIAQGSITCRYMYYTSVYIILHEHMYNAKPSLFWGYRLISNKNGNFEIHTIQHLFLSEGRWKKKNILPYHSNSAILLYIIKWLHGVETCMRIIQIYIKFCH